MNNSSRLRSQVHPNASINVMSHNEKTNKHEIVLSEASNSTSLNSCLKYLCCEIIPLSIVLFFIMACGLALGLALYFVFQNQEYTEIQNKLKSTGAIRVDTFVRKIELSVIAVRSLAMYVCSLFLCIYNWKIIAF